LPPLLAAGLWWGLGRRTALSWLCLLCWTGVALHVAYDVITPWGTMLLYPFSLERFALDWLFIVDFVTWVAPVAAAVVAWRRPAWSRRAAVAFLAGIALYAVFSGVVHGAVVDVTSRAERGAGRGIGEIEAFPELGAPFRWQGLAMATPIGPGSEIRRYAVTGLPPGARLEARIPRGFDEPWAQRALATDDGQAYLWWARVPVARIIPKADHVEVTLADLRFTRRVVPSAATWGPFSVQFTFDRRTGILRDVEW
jgi:inner membrane protein